MSGWVEALVSVMLENETLRSQAEHNSRTQFIDSPDLADAVTDVVMTNQGTHNKMTDTFYADPAVRVTLVEQLGALFHLLANDAATDEPARATAERE